MRKAGSQPGEKWCKAFGSRNSCPSAFSPGRGRRIDWAAQTPRRPLVGGSVSASTPLTTFFSTYGTTAEEIWRKYDSVEQRLTASVSERMLDLAGLRLGMRVLDLATGRGEPAIRAAHRVGPTGVVVGVDCSEGLLQMARERAAREGVSSLDLRALNAERLEGIPMAHFHVTLARWGRMYFDSPIAALSAARRAMVRHGILVAALWAEPERVPYFTLPRHLLAKYTTLPPIDPDAPGTFRYADPVRIRRDFTAAGFIIDHLEEMDVAVMEAQSGAEVVAWARAFGLTRLLKDLPEELQQAWEADLVKETERLRKNDRIRLGGVTRIVVASSAGSPPSDGM